MQPSVSEMNHFRFNWGSFKASFITYCILDVHNPQYLDVTSHVSSILTLPHRAPRMEEMPGSSTNVPLTIPWQTCPRPWPSLESGSDRLGSRFESSTWRLTLLFTKLTLCEFHLMQPCRVVILFNILLKIS